VEAKSRHRPSVLWRSTAGFDMAAVPEPDVTDRLRSALTQRRPMPFVVCIELNLPPAAHEEEAPAEARRRARRGRSRLAGVHGERREVSGNIGRGDQLLASRGDPSEPDPRGWYQSFIAVRDPEHPFNRPETQQQILDALAAYGNLPNGWEDFDR
jgi:hypothetical protein